MAVPTTLPMFARRCLVALACLLSVNGVSDVWAARRGTFEWARVVRWAYYLHDHCNAPLSKSRSSRLQQFNIEAIRIMGEQTGKTEREVVEWTNGLFFQAVQDYGGCGGLDLSSAGMSRLLREAGIN